MNYQRILDEIADIEHQQWIHWSQSLAGELKAMRRDLDEAMDDNAVINRIDGITKRWSRSWKPFKKLTKEQKDKDREWAELVIPLVPNKCPVHQCGGFMQSKERKPPKDFIESEHYDGDEQTPDLICSNCGAIYQFKGFEGEKVEKDK